MTATIRDIAIIVLALESVVIGAILIILTIQVWQLVRLLRHEIKPILESTQETVGTVRGTANFLGHHLVNPVVRVAGYASGVRQAVRTLAGFRRSSPGSPDNPPPTNGRGTGEP
ncbi:MAG: hypothetical protein IT330_18200 [Anaerolineae bacterium]|nr:hypothetical protein [Anaerolineae bacterium]